MNNPTITVLFIADNAGQSERVQQSIAALPPAQFEFVSAERLQQAYYLLSQETQETVDIVLFDISLSGRSWLTDLVTIRSTAPDIPIVVLTDTEEHGAQEAIERGAQDYLVKEQLNAQTLRHVLPCVVERYHTQVRQARLVRAEKVDEARFHNLITRNVDGIVVVDRNGIVRFVNPAAELLFGHSAEELLGEIFGFPVVAGETTEIDVLRKGDDVSGVAEMRVVETEWEGEAAYLTSLREITAHKRALNALHEQERLNRAILNAMDSHIAVIDEHGVIITINESWHTFADTHTTPAVEHATVGANYFDMCQQIFGEQAAIPKGIRLVLSGDQGLFEAEYAYQDTESDDSEELWFQVRAVPLKQYHDVKVVVSHTDITERKRAISAEARAESIAARMREQEREIQALLQISSASPSSITASMFGMHPLREGAPRIFEELARTYGALMDMAMEQRAFKVKHDVSEGLRSMAERLGFLRVGPRDIIDIHGLVLQEKSRDSNPIKAHAYVEEGRMMALELMGYLVSYYRNYSLGMSKNLLLDQQEQKHSTVQEKD